VQKEVYVVVAGSGRAKLEDEIVEIGLWDVLRVAPQVVRSFEAGPDGMEMICVGGTAPGRRQRALHGLLARLALAVGTPREAVRAQDGRDDRGARKCPLRR
jgi:hypothetical protein